MLILVNHQRKIQRRANERILQAEELKTKFLQSMCHEIRTPLNAISGFSQMLTHGGNLSPERKREFSDTIMRETERLTNMLDDLLYVATIKVDNSPFPTSQVSVHSLCNELVQNFQDSNPEIEWTYEGSGHEMAETNQEHLEKVITSLMANVVKHCPEGSKAKLSCQTLDDKALIVLEDNGPGIPPDKHEFVFQSFTKIDEFVPGIGMGLHICSAVIQRLGGTIRIDSDYAAGSRFVIALPRYA